MKINLKEYTVNTAQIVISDNANKSITCYYSYNTLIAIKDIDNMLFVSENKNLDGNIFSQTTGKHLNQIESNKSNRISRSFFVKIANKILSQITLKELKKVV